jgi:hypothetical protein
MLLVPRQIAQATLDTPAQVRCQVESGSALALLMFLENLAHEGGFRLAAAPGFIFQPAEQPIGNVYS